MMSKIKRNKKYSSFLDRFLRDETFHQSQFENGWTEAWCKYLDYIANIDISHQAPPEQRNRKIELYHFRYDSEKINKKTMKARPDYQMATSAMRSVNHEAGVKPTKLCRRVTKNPTILILRNADDRYTASWSSNQWYHQSTDDNPAAGNRVQATWWTQKWWNNTELQDDTKWAPRCPSPSCAQRGGRCKPHQLSHAQFSEHFVASLFHQSLFV